MMEHTDPNTISFTESNAVGPSFEVTETAPDAVTAPPRSSNSWAMPPSVAGPFQLGSRENQILRTTFSQSQINRKNQIRSSERRPDEGTIESIKHDRNKTRKEKKQGISAATGGHYCGKKQNPGGVYSCYLYTTIGPTSVTALKNQRRGTVRRGNPCLAVVAVAVVVVVVVVSLRILLPDRRLGSRLADLRYVLLCVMCRPFCKPLVDGGLELLAARAIFFI